MKALALLGMLTCIALALLGMLAITKGTLGVGTIGLACAIGITARILQAEANHTALKRLIEDKSRQP